MRNSLKVLTASALALPILLVSGCVTVPEGPSIVVMPGPYKPFEVFVNDEAICRQYASAEIGVSPSQAQAGEVAGTAVAGAAVGAAAGALLGGGRGAAAGAGVGLVAGTAVGAGSANQTGYSLQRRYDIAYSQCMYSKGNQVPGYGYSAVPPPQPYSSAPPPPPSQYSPPPPQ